eukprot:COSAG01_NODE_1380_length_10522_cov_9.989063_3_plen_206_part_00
MSSTTVDSPHGLHCRRRTVGTRHTPRVELPPLRNFHLAVSERDALAGAWRPSAPNGGRATFATQQRVHAAVPLNSARRGSRRQPPQSPARGRTVAGGSRTPTRVVRGGSGGSLAGVRWDASAATSGDAAVRPLDTPRHHRGTVPPRPRPPATGRRGASAAPIPAEAGGALRGVCPPPGPRPPVYSTRRVLVSSSSSSSSSSWRHR